MAESNTPIAIFGIIALILILIGIVVLVVFNPVPTIINVPYNIENGTIVKEPAVDLRLVALPYLRETDIQAMCTIDGGEWHEESDFAGCVGFGPDDCNTGIVVSAMTQCVGAGGNWTCGSDGIYCSI